MSRDNPPTVRHDSADAAEDSPGVPGFRTWRGIYVFVFGVFVLIVVGLTVFTQVYS